MPATADQLICQVSAPWLLLLHTFVFVTFICILAFRTPIRSAPVSQNTQPPYFSSGSTLWLSQRTAGLGPKGSSGLPQPPRGSQGWVADQGCWSFVSWL
jgi:hypothetical protein